MTVFGPDISSYQQGLNLAQLADAEFVIAKATEGTYYTDACYDGWRLQAATLHKPFVWYHFLSGEDPAAQVQHTLSHIGDHTLPGMLDVEPEAGFTPTVAQALAYVDAAHAAGLNLRLLYLPRWYWARLGLPDLTPFARRGVGLVSSSYPVKTGTAQQIYPGDWWAAGWEPYGGVTPLLYQFTNQASDGGQPLDYNAFRGTLAELAAALTPGGSSMGQIPPSISQKWPDLAGDFPADAQFTDETALIWADAGARAAALYALQARDAIVALAARAGQPVVTDVAGLAAALGPLLHPAVDVDALVASLLPHLPGPPDPGVFAAALAAHIRVEP